MTEKWTEQRAWDWHNAQPWLTGCNFVPSTAINQIEMFSEATFDPETIDRELKWAHELGFNTMRTYLHDLCWREDPVGFLDRIDAYLAIASKHGIRTLLTIFDDCWHEPSPGQQPEPRAGVHNSGWARSPGRDILLDRGQWDGLRIYVEALADRFGGDQRVLGWDVYNEVTNLVLPSRSLPDEERARALGQIELTREAQADAAVELMTLSFGWLREKGVTQPLTAGIYYKNDALSDVLIELSDIVSFHHYRERESLERLVEKLKKANRPLWCTEYLNRRGDCTFESHMTLFQAEKIGAWNWGLVDGKTQTKFAWSDRAGGGEPAVWFHDILRADGTAYEPSEVALIKSLRQKADPT